MSITSLGTGSGLDLENLLSQLVAAERQPVENRLNSQEAGIQASISAFGSLSSALADFRNAANNLDSADNFNGRSASSSNSDIFTVSATGTAATGSFNINVLDLAQAQRLATGDFSGPGDTIGTGSLTIASGASSFDVTVTDGSLTGIRDAINNAEGNTGVTATIITVDELDGSNQPTGNTVSRLVLTADETGTDNALTITVDDDDLSDEDGAGLSQLFYQAGSLNNQLTELSAAQNARITLDGLSVSSNTNVFEGVIEGVTITAQSTSPDVVNDPPSVLTVERDTSSVRRQVEEFVESFNTLTETLGQLTQADPENGTSAALSGDFTVRTLESQIRRIFTSRFAGLDPSFDSLVDIGITTNASGQLEVDSDQLNNALDNGLDDVTTLFSGTSGIATRLDTLLDGYLNSGGLISTREATLQDSLSDISDQRDNLALRLDSVERRFRQRFAALDALVAQFNSTGTFLTQQLANTAAIINRPSNNNN